MNRPKRLKIPDNAYEIAKEHLRQGWSYTSLPGRFRVSPRTWHRWLEARPDLKALNPNPKPRKCGRWSILPETNYEF